MMGTLSVNEVPQDARIRSIRVRLAHALTSFRPQDDEIVLQLERALGEEGSEPTDSEIYFDLGRAWRARGQLPAALHAFVRAVIAAPTSASAAAEAGLSLMNVGDRSDLASSLPSDELDVLRGAVRECTQPRVEIALLAARLSRLRGDRIGAIESLMLVTAMDQPGSPAAFEELASLLLEQGQPERALGYLDRLGSERTTAQFTVQAWALLDSARFAQARDVAEKIRSANPTAAAAVGALARFCLNEPQLALEDLQAAERSLETALAEAIVRLHLASLGGPTLDSAAIGAANAAAITAARIDPTSLDVLLVRAQVQLEGCINVDEGRGLLASAVERFGSTSLTCSRWLRLQEQARPKNGWLDYFLTEVAAAEGRHDDVLYRASKVNRARTSIAHDAALEMLVADEYRRRGDHAAAASMYTSAATAYDTANDLGHAVAAARLAAEEEPSTQRKLDLAGFLLRFAEQDDLSVGLLASTVADALEALGSTDQEVPVDLVTRSVCLRGVLLDRKADAARTPQATVNWGSMAWLILATLLEPDEASWPMHLAWAFDRVNAQRASLYFARSAWVRNPSSVNAAGSVLAMCVNYYGHIDAEAQTLVQAYQGDPKWLATVLVYSDLADGKLAQLHTLSRDEVFDAPWAHEVLARVNAMLGGIESAVQDVRLVQTEAEEPPRRWGVASEMSLLLGEPEKARDLVNAGRASGELSEDEATYRLATIDLLACDGQNGFDLMQRYLSQRVVPYDLRSAAHIELPLLMHSRGCSPGADRALAQLVTTAKARLEQVERELPPLSQERLDIAEGSERDLIVQLLEVVELVDAKAYDAARRALGRILEQFPGGLIGQAVHQLAEQYAKNGLQRRASTAS